MSDYLAAVRKQLSCRVSAS